MVGVKWAVVLCRLHLEVLHLELGLVSQVLLRLINTDEVLVPLCKGLLDLHQLVHLEVAHQEVKDLDHHRKGSEAMHLVQDRSAFLLLLLLLSNKVHHNHHSSMVRQYILNSYNSNNSNNLLRSIGLPCHLCHHNSNNLNLQIDQSHQVWVQGPHHKQHVLLQQSRQQSIHQVIEITFQIRPSPLLAH